MVIDFTKAGVLRLNRPSQGPSQNQPVTSLKSPEMASESESITFPVLNFYGKRSKRKSNHQHRAEKLCMRLEKAELKVPKVFLPRIADPSVCWETFFRQQAAFDFADENPKDRSVFAFESSAALEKENQGGQRRYLVSSLRQFWHHYSDLLPTQRHHYEVIREGSRCKLYFDLEFMTEFNPSRNGDDMVDILIKYVCLWLKECFDVSCSKPNVLDLDASTSNKFSRHLIFQLHDNVFENCVAAGYFVRHIFTVLVQYLRLKTRRVINMAAATSQPGTKEQLSAAGQGSLAGERSPAKQTASTGAMPPLVQRSLTQQTGCTGEMTPFMQRSPPKQTVYTRETLSAVSKIPQKETSPVRKRKKIERKIKKDFKDCSISSALSVSNGQPSNSLDDLVRSFQESSDEDERNLLEQSCCGSFLAETSFSGKEEKKALRHCSNAEFFDKEENHERVIRKEAGFCHEDKGGWEVDECDERELALAALAAELEGRVMSHGQAMESFYSEDDDSSDEKELAAAIERWEKEIGGGGLEMNDRFEEFDLCIDDDFDDLALAACVEVSDREMERNWVDSGSSNMEKVLDREIEGAGVDCDIEERCDKCDTSSSKVNVLDRGAGVNCDIEETCDTVFGDGDDLELSLLTQACEQQVVADIRVEGEVSERGKQGKAEESKARALDGIKQDAEGETTEIAEQRKKAETKGRAIGGEMHSGDAAESGEQREAAESERRAVDDVMQRVCSQFSLSELTSLLVKNKDGREATFCDLGVYTKNRNFRLYLSSKLNKHNPLLVSKQNRHVPPKARAMPRSSYEEDVFMASLISVASSSNKAGTLTFGPNVFEMAPSVPHTRTPTADMSNTLNLGFGGIVMNKRTRHGLPSTTGHAASPHPDLDLHILSLVSGGDKRGHIRTWRHNPASDDITYYISGYRWCSHIAREHRSNNIFYTVSLVDGTYTQGCYDNDCSHAHRKVEQLPEAIKLKIAETRLERGDVAT